MIGKLDPYSPGVRTLIDRLQSDPVFHLERVQGIETLEEYQRRICREVAEYDRVAIAACHDVGKTWTMARIVLWFLTSFPNSIVITTAPTYIQVEKLLWAEIRNGHSKSKTPLGGRMLQTEWKIDDKWYAVGLSPKEDKSQGDGGQAGSSFQGFHARHILIVFDEATGVPTGRWTQAEGMLTSASVKWVAVGNPTSRNSEFYQCFKSRLWRKVYLSCFDSPNLPANGIHNIEDLRREVELVRVMPEEQIQKRLKSYKIVQPYLLTLSWVVSMALPDKWGMDHPLFVSKALGQFPKSDSNVLIPLDVVELAQRREPDPHPADQSYFGLDVARMGSDNSVLTEIIGKRVLPPDSWAHKDTTETVGRTIRALSACKYPSRIAVDATGVGSGVYDGLVQAQKDGLIHKDVEILEVHNGSACADEKDRLRFFNRKAQMFDRLAKDLKKDLCLPPESSVYSIQLPTIIFFVPKGRTMIESKDDYKKRTGRSSPDESDSLMLANEARYIQIPKPAPRVRRLSE